jgi:hypothetical protein
MAMEAIMARLAIKWVPVDVCSRFQAIIDGTADLECGSSPVSLSRMRIVDFYNIVFADSTGALVKANAGINRRRAGFHEHAGNSGSAGAAKA